MVGLNTKSQTPDFKQAPNTKFPSKANGDPESLRHWIFFGVWILEFGVS
jgi:hypothetical protein